MQSLRERLLASSQVDTREASDESAAQTLLVAGLLTTTSLAFLLGNLAAGPFQVFWQTLPIYGICVAIVLSLYGLSQRMGGLAPGMVGTLGLLTCVTYGPRGLFTVAFGLAAAWGGLTLIAQRRHLNGHARAIGMMGVVGSTLMLASSNSSFDVFRQLHEGTFHMDLPFHASIAAMIKNYGVTSTGLHGLVYTPYHVLSHALMASISLLSGGPVVMVYAVAHWILFAPLLLVSWSYFLIRAGGFKLNSIPLVWTLHCLALLALGWWQAPLSAKLSSPEPLAPLTITDTITTGLFFMGSESHVLGLTLFVLASPYLLLPKLTGRDGAVMMALAVLMASAKGPVGLIFAALCLLRTIRVAGSSTSRDWGLALAVLFAVVVAVFPSASGASSRGDMSLELFSHVRRYGHFGEYIGQMVPENLLHGQISLRNLAYGVLGIFIFLLQFFVTPLLALGYARPWPSRGDDSGTLVKIYLWGSLALSLMALLFLKLPDGNAFWFFHLATVAALPFWIGSLATQLMKLREPENQRGMLLRSLTVGVLAVPFLVVGVVEWFEVPLRESKKGKRAENSLIARLVEIRDQASLNVAFKPLPGSISMLASSHCLARPFILPAVSERPWLNLISPEDGCELKNYLYNFYGVEPGHPDIGVAPVLPSNMRLQEMTFPLSPHLPSLAPGPDRKNAHVSDSWLMGPGRGE
ncbi:MAG: hypothetical protein VKP62_00035 [Candidatus Sericytochromatia bacterium]|nr:hypothetical protein [Candidatus Sericytochromatia bacterium]